MKIKSRDIFPLEFDHGTERIVSIGSFRFLESAFDKANDFLIAISSRTENRYLVVDELGKLELKHKGLHEAVKVLLSNNMLYTNHNHLILIVRTTLLKTIIEYYNIKSYILISKEDLTKQPFA